MDHRPAEKDFASRLGGSAHPDDVQHHFDTPDWLRPRADAAELLGEAGDLPGQAGAEATEPAEAAATTALRTPPAIPQQPLPTHDEAREQAHARARQSGPAIPHEARWKAKHKLRTTFGLLLVPFLAAAAAGGYYAWSIDSMEYIPVAAIPVVIIAGIWGAMMSTSPRVTTLKGSKITVRHDGIVDEFDLANPDQAIETSRDASDPRWKVTLERVDGSQLVFTRKHVPAAEFMTILQHYRRIAAELLEQRIRRYQG
jgi:hypothetical protein